MNVLLLIFAYLLIFPNAKAQTIYVKASRVATLAEDVTSNVEILEPEGDLESTLGKSSSVFISEQSAYGSASSLKMRGTERGFSKIMLDDIELSDPTDINRSFQLNLINNLYIDKALILKGPQSTHYGSDTVGGLIKLSTGESFKNIYQLKLSQGSNDYKSVNLNVSRKLENTSWRILTSFEDTDGISSYSNGFERDFYKNLNFYGVIEQELNTKATLKYSGLHIRTRQDIDDFGKDRANFDLLTYEQKIHQIKLTQKLFGDRFKSSILLNRTDIFRKSQGQYPSEQNGQSERAELFGIYYLNEFITPSFIFEYTKENMTNISSFTNFKNKSLESYSFSTNIDLKKDRWSSQIGILYLRHTTFSNLDSSKVGVSYKFNSKLRGFLNWSRSFVLPTVYQVYFSSNASQLEPTLGESFEVGYSFSFEDYNFTMTLFDNQFKNQIDYDRSENKYRNIKESQVQGLEFAIDYRIKNFDLGASSSLLRSVDKASGKYLGKSPRLITKLNLKYLISDNSFIETRWQYVGDRNDSGRMPSYTVGDLHFKKSFFKLSINNFLDKSFENTRSYQTLGRNYLMSVTYEI